MTPTPDLDPWFSNDDDQFHCITMIQNLNCFPFKITEYLLKENYCEFEKCVSKNYLEQVKVLTNMWLQDGKHHDFPIKTPEDNFISSTKA